MMCFENVNMSGDMSRAVFSLLLFGTVLQALPLSGKDLNVLHYETAQAAVGQNISLPCIFNDTFDIDISQVEWRRENTKLVVHHKDMGTHYSSHDENVVFGTETGDDNRLMGSYLHLYQARRNISGTYVCELTTYPFGSVSRRTRLEVKDAEVTCDKNITLEVCLGENVTVHCEVHLYPQAQYRWFKNETMVSETGSLEVRVVEESQAGVYTLMVTTESKPLQRSFNIIIHTPTKSPSTAAADLTSQNTDHSSTGVNIPTTVSGEANFTAETSGSQNVTSSVPTVAITLAEIHLSNNSSQATTANPYATESHNNSFTVWPITGSSTTTLGLDTYYGSKGVKTESVTEEHVPTDVYHQHTSSLTTLEIEPTTLGGMTTTSGNLSSSHLPTGDKTVDATETAGWGIGFVFLWMAILLTLVMCLLGFLYRRHTIRKRMDRPPPFKPPPPPRKYTSVKPYQMSNSCSCAC